jgi:hypothetical protein
MSNILHIKLCYEILNIPVKDLANQLGLAPYMINDMVAAGGWKRWFPTDECDFFLVEEKDINEGEDLFTVKIERYSEYANQKLKVFEIAKKLALAPKILDIEMSMLDKMKEAIEEVNHKDTRALKDLSSSYTNLVAKGAGTSVGISQDPETGLPTVVIKDLSGS